MDTNPFRSFTIRPAINGLIVEHKTASDTISSSTLPYVFADFDEFVDWLRKETQIPDDDS